MDILIGHAIFGYADTNFVAGKIVCKKLNVNIVHLSLTGRWRDDKWDLYFSFLYGFYRFFKLIMAHRFEYLCIDRPTILRKYASIIKPREFHGLSKS